MQPTNMFCSTLLVTFLVVVILGITCAAEGTCPRLRRLLPKLGAPAKNRLAGFVIVVSCAVTVGAVKSYCAGAAAWAEALVTFITGFGSAVAAVFLVQGFPSFKDKEGESGAVPK